MGTLFLLVLLFSILFGVEFEIMEGPRGLSGGAPEHCPSWCRIFHPLRGFLDLSDPWREGFSGPSGPMERGPLGF